MRKMKKMQHVAMPALYEWVCKYGSLEKAAEEIGVSTLAMWEWCSGRRVPRNKQKLSKATGIPAEKLVSEAEGKWQMDREKVVLHELYDWIYKHGNINWFADEIQVHRSTVYKWLRGEVGISVGMMMRVMEFTKLPMKALVRKGDAMYEYANTDA